MSATATPAMRQYLDAKQQHRDDILLFRMGDFYEMFYEDALVAARALELTLTSRSKDTNGGGIPMCGVPFHAVDGYIARLVKKGFRVAICDHRGRCMDVRTRVGAPDAARSTAGRRAGRLRPGSASGGRVGGGRAGSLSARDAKGRSGARAHDRVPAAS